MKSIWGKAKLPFFSSLKAMLQKRIDDQPIISRENIREAEGIFLRHLKRVGLKQDWGWPRLSQSSEIQSVPRPSSAWAGPLTFFITNNCDGRHRHRPKHAQQ